MFGVWSFLRQFMYTKFIVVTDDDVDIRDWKEVVWAITTRMDPVRDTTLVDHTPIDYLDFASPVSGLGGKMGLDATNKWPGETSREWGRPIRRMPPSSAGRRNRRCCGEEAAGSTCRVRRARPRVGAAGRASGPRPERQPARLRSARRRLARCSPSDMPISTPLTSVE